MKVDFQGAAPNWPAGNVPEKWPTIQSMIFGFCNRKRVRSFPIFFWGRIQHAKVGGGCPPFGLSGFWISELIHRDSKIEAISAVPAIVNDGITHKETPHNHFDTDFPKL